MEFDKRLRKNAIKVRLLPMILMTLLAVFCCALGLSYWKDKNKAVPDIMDQTEDTLKRDDWYSIDTNMIIDAFAEDDKGTEFLIMLEQDSTIIALYVPKKNVELAYRIVDATWSYLNEETDAPGTERLAGRGPLNGMSKQEEQFFRERLEELGLTNSEIAQHAQYLKLDLKAGASAGSDAAIIFVIAGAALAISLIMLIRLLSGAYRKKVDAVIARNQLIPELIEEDLANGRTLKSGVFGRRYALIGMSTQSLIDYQDLVWAYKQTTTTRHRLYGIIPVGKTVTYAVRFVTKDKVQTGCNVKNEEEADDLICYVAECAPFAIYGYTEEREQLMKTNFESLVQTVEERKNNGQLL